VRTSRHYPFLLYVQRIEGNVIRAFFDDGYVAELRLPIQGRPRRLQVLFDGAGLKFGGRKDELSAPALHRMRPLRAWHINSTRTGAR